MTDVPKTRHDANGRRLRWAGVLFALVLPSAITWAYFVSAERLSSGAQQSIFLAVKTFQFALPIVWTALVLREPLRTGRLSTRGVVLGVAFAVAVVAVGWIMFDQWLRDTSYFVRAAALIDEKIDGFGIDSVLKYGILALFYSLFHSLMEEYYWRWFAFRQLRALVRLWPAVVISAVAFTSHHVIVLNEFFGDTPTLVALLSGAVAVGGAFWAWLYDRTNSLIAPWLSHLVIDAGIFWIGYDLLRGGM